MPKVNPNILVWARETASVNEADAAKKLNIRESREGTALERLTALESGEVAPTRAMLAKMAKLYRRPLVTFYLSAPPKRGDRGQDFRSLPIDHPDVYEALLDALIRDVQSRQSLVRSAILDEEDAAPLGFVGSASMEDGVDSLVNSLRTTLDLRLELYREARNVDDAFQVLRSHTEAIGVFVLLLGNLGSHHTNIDLETFRGFVLADNIAPFIIINDQDHRAAWSFTLLHELTHLWLGQTGVSGTSSERAIEKFCNDVASEFLVPTEELLPLRGVASLGIESAVRIIGQFADERHVSRSMVAYKLYRVGVLDVTAWTMFRDHLRDLWMDSRDSRRRKSKTAKGGPDYYVVRRHRLGNALMQATARLMAAGALTTTKAGRVLGVKPKNVQNLLTTELGSVG